MDLRAESFKGTRACNSTSAVPIQRSLKWAIFRPLSGERIPHRPVLAARDHDDLNHIFLNICIQNITSRVCARGVFDVRITDLGGHLVYERRIT